MIFGLFTLGNNSLSTTLYVQPYEGAALAGRGQIDNPAMNTRLAQVIRINVKLKTKIFLTFNINSQISIVLQCFKTFFTSNTVPDTQVHRHTISRRITKMISDVGGIQYALLHFRESNSLKKLRNTVLNDLVQNCVQEISANSWHLSVLHRLSHVI